MAKDFIQPGNNLTLTAPAGGVTSGMALFIGAIFGVASVTASEGQPFALETVGCWWLTKVSAEAWVEGDPIYWDAGEEKVTKVAAGNQIIGVAIASADNPSTAGQVRLNGVFGLASEEEAGSS